MRLCLFKVGGRGWIRTIGVSYVTDLQSATFANSVHPPIIYWESRISSLPSYRSTLSLQDYARCAALCIFFVAFMCIISTTRDIAGRPLTHNLISRLRQERYIAAIYDNLHKTSLRITAQLRRTVSNLVRVRGFEPPTNGLKVRCSTN